MLPALPRQVPRRVAGALQASQMLHVLQTAEAQREGLLVLLRLLLLPLVLLVLLLCPSRHFRDSPKSTSSPRPLDREVY
jgi:hypothetical protein